MKKLKIGISANLLYKGKYHPHKNIWGVEAELCQWLADAGVIPCLIPNIEDSKITIDDIVANLDAIIFSGGVDVSPQSYGEEAIKEEWKGDKNRDDYEIKIFNSAIRQKKPILGICRGHQLINVALGGSLYQDIDLQIKGGTKHRDDKIYDKIKHKIDIVPETPLAEIFPSTKQAIVNSVHHQAIKKLGEGLKVQAISSDDRVIESVYLNKEDNFVMGMQWHPEWVKDREILSSDKILSYFLQQIRR